MYPNAMSNKKKFDVYISIITWINLSHTDSVYTVMDLTVLVFAPSVYTRFTPYHISSTVQSLRGHLMILDKHGAHGWSIYNPRMGFLVMIN